MCIRTYVEENIEKYSGLTTWTLSFPQSSLVLPRFRHRWLQCLTRKSPGGPPVPGSGFQMWSACMSRAAHLELHMYSYTKQKKTKQHHTPYDSKAQPSGWPGCRTCFVHDINTSTGVLHCCFKGGGKACTAYGLLSSTADESLRGVLIWPGKHQAQAFAHDVLRFYRTSGRREAHFLVTRCISRRSWSSRWSSPVTPCDYSIFISHPGIQWRSRARLFIPENNVALCKMEYLTLCLQPPKKSSLFQLPARPATLLDLPSVSGKKNNCNN